VDDQTQLETYKNRYKFMLDYLNKPKLERTMKEVAKFAA